MDFRYADIPSGVSEASLRQDHGSTGRFTLRTRAPTDIWRKPPSRDVFDAPMMYKSMPISQFQRARVTATGDWKTLYDQGGLCLVLPPTKSAPKQKRWIKAGIEFYTGKPCMSVVAASDWADWSLCPLSPEDEAAGRMTVEFERDRKEDGSPSPVLRVFLIGPNNQKLVIREVTWAFHGTDESEELQIAMYAAKPTKDSREFLEVHFENFELDP